MNVARYLASCIDTGISIIPQSNEFAVEIIFEIKFSTIRDDHLYKEVFRKIVKAGNEELAKKKALSNLKNDVLLRGNCSINKIFSIEVISIERYIREKEAAEAEKAREKAREDKEYEKISKRMYKVKVSALDREFVGEIIVKGAEDKWEAADTAVAFARNKWGGKFESKNVKKIPEKDTSKYSVDVSWNDYIRAKWSKLLGTDLSSTTPHAIGEENLKLLGKQ